MKNGEIILIIILNESMVRYFIRIIIACPHSSNGKSKTYKPSADRRFYDRI